MKTQQRLAAILTAAFILSCSFPAFAAETDRIPEETIKGQEIPEVHNEKTTDKASLSEMITVSGNKAEFTAENAPEKVSLAETAAEPEDETGFPIPDEAPAFYARIAFRMGYTVIGTFMDFTPDIIQIQTLYSLDGENWKTGTEDWNLFNLGTDDEGKLYDLQNQPCLFNIHEPLKSYIAGETDRFYLKLLITKKNGLSYETQSAVIERGGLQPIPEGTECRALFSSDIAVRESDPSIPYRYRKYGRYQLTIRADATAEEVSALLPDTLPVEIQLDNGPDFIAIGIVDCPVTWKPLSLPRLSAGESIMIPDAAEEILVPAGTLVSTPIGTFQLDKPLSLDNPPSTDEVRLVLNVSTEDRNPTGTLRAGKNGLEMAFHHKPTGASSIQTYVLTEGESKWTELSRLPLPEIFNQPSTANSGYALLLRNDQEPYLSYLAAEEAGETPSPFFIGLKIEGGVYDGRQLVLAWPDIYEQLPDLPEVGGAEGNEGNAGADNKDDSTESGQRPNLPQTPDDNQEERQPTPAPDGGLKEQQPASNSSHKKQEPASAYTPQTASAASENQNALSADESFSDFQPERQGSQFSSGQRPNLTQTILDTADTSAANQENSLKSTPLAEQAAADIKDIEEEETIPAFFDTKTVFENTAENDIRIPLLPVITTIVAGGCIGAAVCKAGRYSPFHRITGKIRNILHK